MVKNYKTGGRTDVEGMLRLKSYIWSNFGLWSDKK